MNRVSSIMEQMIAYSAGNPHDVHHFMKVWAYAKLIGEMEQLHEQTQLILEIAAITHDIACPLCREKYGSTNGKLQEKEGAVLVAEFLKDSGFAPEEIDRIAFLVGHHHTYASIDGPDYQILLEADYLVNAHESQYSPENIRQAYENIFVTPSGRMLLRTIYAV